ncbi:glycerol dehydrogenase [Celeribacter sp. SCSIO 80788]|uniref:glycerol dehydrogenase n=1 Tax=Celeribacter sp. SCSIO 80788 TaxID=3117013 RepID=UPI003DA437FC
MIVFGAPRRYIQGPDALDALGREIAPLGKQVAFLADDIVMGLCFNRARAGLEAAGCSVMPVLFPGEITYDIVKTLTGALSETPIDVIIGAGGGKTLDAGKLVARDLGCAFVSLPTVASNDSPTSHVSAVYDADHRLSAIERCPFNPDLVVVDTKVILGAPKVLLSAGVGDAIVKLFEVEQCMASGGLNVFGAKAPLSALALARTCYQTLRSFLVPAYAAYDAGEATPEFEALVEATVLMSGLAFESGGLSVSHGMTRGLSAVPGIADALHGHQVAYGLLVQLELEDRPPEFMADMRDFYRLAGLPLKLADMGGDTRNNSLIKTISDISAEASHMKKFHRNVCAKDIADAIHRIEAA